MPCMPLTFEKANDLFHGSEATEAFKLSKCDGHLRLVVVVMVMLWKLGMEPSRQLLMCGPMGKGNKM